MPKIFIVTAFRGHQPSVELHDAEYTSLAKATAAFHALAKVHITDPEVYIGLMRQTAVTDWGRKGIALATKSRGCGHQVEMYPAFYEA